MTTVTPARRRLFASPSPAAKRRRVMTQTRLVKLQQPELKQFVSSANLDTHVNGNAAHASIPDIMSQGNDGDQFVGSKYRILRVRIYFDYTDVTLTSGLRLALGIPKNPASTTILDTSAQGTVIPHNMREVTILKEMFLKTDGSNLNGYMEWNGPLNVEMNSVGNVALRNNLILQINADGQAANIAVADRTRIEILFTG